jgi:hypothetical protein
MHKNDSERSKTSRSNEARYFNNTPWNQDLEVGQTNLTNPLSKKIPDVWKNQTFTGMIFTIEKCRDLK